MEEGRATPGVPHPKFIHDGDSINTTSLTTLTSLGLHSVAVLGMRIVYAELSGPANTAPSWRRRRRDARSRLHRLCTMYTACVYMSDPPPPPAARVPHTTPRMLIHVSTAFVHGGNSGTASCPLPQELPDLGGRSPERLYRSAQRAPSGSDSGGGSIGGGGAGKEALDAMADLGYPNTYTFTKALGEHLLVRALSAHNRRLDRLAAAAAADAEESDDDGAGGRLAAGGGGCTSGDSCGSPDPCRLRLRVVRPSIVGPAWVFPWPGWTGEQPSTVTGKTTDGGAGIIFVRGWHVSGKKCRGDGWRLTSYVRAAKQHPEVVGDKSCHARYVEAMTPTKRSRGNTHTPVQGIVASGNDLPSPHSVRIQVKLSPHQARNAPSVRSTRAYLSPLIWGGGVMHEQSCPRRTPLLPPQPKPPPPAARLFHSPRG